jgi:hypothetical protein
MVDCVSISTNHLFGGNPIYRVYGFPAGCPVSIEAAIGVSYLHKPGASFDNREAAVDHVEASAVRSVS